MYLRHFYRITIPQTFRVLKTLRSVATPHQFYHNPFNRRVIPSHEIRIKQDRRLITQQTKTLAEEQTVEYEYVKKATSNANTLIIDVREPEEVNEHGKIPNSINIPLANVIPALSNLSEKEFKKIFEKPKPKQDTEMIFYCMIGKRSEKAQVNAINLGYKNSKNYLGSWTDWAHQTQTKK